MNNKEDDLYKYLPYVTLREGWSEIKGYFFIWLGGSVLSIGLGLLFDFGASKIDIFWSILPKPVWYVLGFAAFSWLARGEEFRIAFPQTFKHWLLMNAVFAIMFLAQVPQFKNQSYYISDSCAF